MSAVPETKAAIASSWASSCGMGRALGCANKGVGTHALGMQGVKGGKIGIAFYQDGTGSQAGECGLQQCPDGLSHRGAMAVDEEVVAEIGVAIMTGHMDLANQVAGHGARYRRPHQCRYCAH